jgi:hypothetical protein
MSLGVHCMEKGVEVRVHTAKQNKRTRALSIDNYTVCYITCRDNGLNKHLCTRFPVIYRLVAHFSKSWSYCLSIILQTQFYHTGTDWSSQLSSYSYLAKSRNTLLSYTSIGVTSDEFSLQFMVRCQFDIYYLQIAIHLHTDITLGK